MDQVPERTAGLADRGPGGPWAERTAGRADRGAAPFSKLIPLSPKRFPSAPRAERTAGRADRGPSGPRNNPKP